MRNLSLIGVHSAHALPWRAFEEASSVEVILRQAQDDKGRGTEREEQNGTHQPGQSTLDYGEFGLCKGTAHAKLSLLRRDDREVGSSN